MRFVFVGLMFGPVASEAAEQGLSGLGSQLVPQGIVIGEVPASTQGMDCVHCKRPTRRLCRQPPCHAQLRSVLLQACACLQVSGLRAAELVLVMGDAHVYADHVEPLKQQLQQQPFPFPVRATAGSCLGVLVFHADTMWIVVLVYRLWC